MHQERKPIDRRYRRGRGAGARQPRAGRASWLALALLIFAIPSAAQKAPEVNLATTPYLKRVFSNGEILKYDLAWLKIVGGTAEMRVFPEDDVIRMTSIAESGSIFARIYPVRDEIESVVMRETFSTLSFEKDLREKNRTKQELTIVYPSRGIAVRKGKEIQVPKSVLDPLSSIFFLRTMDLEPGKKHYFEILADGKVYRLEAETLKRETVEINGVKFRTLLVEPKMRHGGIFRDENNRLLIWYTDDERRLPVRIRSELEFGSITASIRSAAVLGSRTAGAP